MAVRTRSGYTFTRNWADRGLLNWHEYLADLAGKPLVYLEIGIFEGRSGCRLLDEFLTHPDARYIGIDIWKYESKYDGPTVEARARANLERHLGKVELIQGSSPWVLRHPRWLPASIDVGYIDGDHGMAGVLADSVLVWPLVKPGGVVIWDDYSSRRRNRQVRLAVDRFLACYPGTYSPLFHARGQFGVRKNPVESAGLP